MSIVDIEYEGREMTVKYHYIPPDDPIDYYPDGSGYPGAPEYLFIDSIFYGGRDIRKLLSASDILEIEDLVLDIINS